MRYNLKKNLQNNKQVCEGNIQMERKMKKETKQELFYAHQPMVIHKRNIKKKHKPQTARVVLHQMVSQPQPVIPTIICIITGIKTQDENPRENSIGTLRDPFKIKHTADHTSHAINSNPPLPMFNYQHSKYFRNFDN
ncbi:hypothetical protein J5N97_006883 [Dioscorea zingiberensis]|uniref:Uncharacterized protein n=1 Tax=Dioscorea zingiberensis TaxID=325984 RepID=A0A9D5DDD2_9LILI|nr:hypothetical protein J5N97_006883 [Dioscorea zingiberensis]